MDGARMNGSCTKFESTLLPLRTNCPRFGFDRREKMFGFISPGTRSRRRKCARARIIHSCDITSAESAEGEMATLFLAGAVAQLLGQHQAILHKMRSAVLALSFPQTAEMVDDVARMSEQREFRSLS